MSTPPAYRPSPGQEPSRNARWSEDFAAYCAAHPEQRFWQALMNWSGFDITLTRLGGNGTRKDLDPFYWENKEG